MESLAESNAPDNIATGGQLFSGSFFSTRFFGIIFSLCSPPKILANLTWFSNPETHYEIPLLSIPVLIQCPKLTPNFVVLSLSSL